MAEKLLINGKLYDELLTPAEVAEALRVSPITLRRWDKKGLWPDGTIVTTPGGHRRYKAAVVAQLLADWNAS